MRTRERGARTFHRARGSRWRVLGIIFIFLFFKAVKSSSGYGILYFLPQKCLGVALINNAVFNALRP